MLLDLSIDIETPKADPALPSTKDIGALLVIMVRNRELGYTDNGEEPHLGTAMRLATNRARTLVRKFEADDVDVHKQWKKFDDLLTHWVSTESDEDPCSTP
jgi:hypothetical protein